MFTPTHTSAKTGLMTTTQDTQTTIEPIYSNRGVTAYAVAGPTPTSIWQIQKTRDGYHVFDPREHHRSPTQPKQPQKPGSSHHADPRVRRHHPSQTQPDPDDIYDDFGLLQNGSTPRGTRTARSPRSRRMAHPDTRRPARQNQDHDQVARAALGVLTRLLHLVRQVTTPVRTLLRGVADADDMCAVCLRGLTAERWEPGR